ncbi:MAG: LuxR C-terminal-related transcriptional regulator [Actinomycetota bacterium]|nr:LuxR C-terminal-related transcriptional regulator [Actinomycetota bacterium]
MASSALSQSDLEAVATFAGSLVEVDSVAALRQRTVEVLPRLVGSTLVAWNEVDFTGNRIDAVIAPVLEPEDLYRRLAEAFMVHVGDHPVIRNYERTGDGRPYAISDFLSQADFHATGIYQNFYRTLGAEDQLSFILPDATRLIGIALNRERRGFSRRDRSTCNLLRPHLVHVYRNVAARAEVQRMLTALDRLAERQGAALIILDRHLVPQHIGADAQRILSRFFAGWDARALPEPVGAWLREPAHSWPLVYQRHGRDVVVRRVQTAEGDVLLLSESTGPDRTSNLRRLGLTARESDVFLLVYEGLATKRIAAELGISPRTVEKHVQRVLDKLGVQSRIGAVRLVSGDVIIKPEP